MKLNIFYLAIVILFAISCSKQEIKKWDSNVTMVQFQSDSFSFSFKLHGDDNATIEVPVLLNGIISDKDKNFSCEIVADSTTLPSDNFEIIETKIAKEKNTGFVKINLTKFGNADSDDTRIWLRLKSNNEFITGPYRYVNCEVKITNKLLPPITWQPSKWMAKYAFGNYSTNYYAIIIEATGYTEFPWHPGWEKYAPGVNDGKPFTAEQKKDIENKIRVKLYELKKALPEGEKLLHEDGNAEGKEIIYGKFY